MKLYTREQMIEAFNYGQNPKGFDWIGDMIDSLTPIELPSDEEIEIKSQIIELEYHGMQYTNFNQGLKKGAELMAKWMRDKILNQIK